MMTEDDERFLRLPLSGRSTSGTFPVAFVVPPLRFVLFPRVSGYACSRMIVCGRNLLQNVRKNLLFSPGCITFAHGSSKKRDVWTSFQLFRFEILSGEMVEWSITAVLKTAVPRGTGGSNPSLSAKWLQDDFKMVVKTAFKISVNRCKTYTYNDFSLYISLHSDG